MSVRVRVFLCVLVRGCAWLCVPVHVCACPSVAVRACAWLCVTVRASACLCVSECGCACLCVAVRDWCRQWRCRRHFWPCVTSRYSIIHVHVHVQQRRFNRRQAVLREGTRCQQSVSQSINQSVERTDTSARTSVRNVRGDTRCSEKARGVSVESVALEVHLGESCRFGNESVRLADKLPSQRA